MASKATPPGASPSEPTGVEVAYEWSVYVGRVVFRWGWLPLVIALGVVATDPRPRLRDCLRLM